jgi:hypothetical protein
MHTTLNIPLYLLPKTAQQEKAATERQAFLKLEDPQKISQLMKVHQANKPVGIFF